jgi:hypothetical protein
MEYLLMGFWKIINLGDRKACWEGIGKRINLKPRKSVSKQPIKEPKIVSLNTPNIKVK